MRRLPILILATGLVLLASLKIYTSIKSRQPADMVFVPAGVFKMGANLERPGDEGPQHSVDLPAFWIDRYEVTNAEYWKCVEADFCSEPDDLRYYQDPEFEDHPVVFVSWYDAKAYCEWRHKRLPTEAEWEKAARGVDGRLYPWGNQLSGGRLNAGNRVGASMPVGSYPSGASPYGALDMAGNVWEWVSDWYAAYPGSRYQSDLFGEKYKVVRGGSWNHPDEDARSYHRDIAYPERALGVVGFRCARSP